MEYLIPLIGINRKAKTYAHITSTCIQIAETLTQSQISLSERQ